MTSALAITVPFFALILLGYAAARLRWVPTESVPAFNGFLLYFAVPAMLFRFAANTPFEQLLNGRFMAAWAACGVVVVVGTTLLAQHWLGVRRRDAAFLGLTAGVGNLGFLGVPLLVGLLGEGAAAAPILAIVVDNILIGSLGLVLAETGGATRKGWRADLRGGLARVAGNPFVIAMLLGALFSAMQWELAGPVAGIVRLLADAAGPCALFAIGVSLVRDDAPLRSPLLALPIAGKLVLHPVLVWGAMHAFGVDPYTTLVAVLAAALPSAGWVFIFATRHEADAGRVSATILLTTALAFLTVSLLVWLMGLTRTA